MAQNEIWVKFLSDISDLKGDVDVIRKEMGKLETGVSKAAGGASGKLMKFGLVMNGIREGMQLLRMAGNILFRPLISGASDAIEVASKFDVVFGKSSDRVRSWAKSYGDQVGRANTELEKMLSGFQDTFVPMGMTRDAAAELSITLSSLVADVASFNNELDADVARDFQSAVVGNHETVRKYGIIITEATLKQEALTSGIYDGTGQLTEMEKVQARVNLIIKGSSDAQGDAIRTADQFANTLKSTRAELKDTTDELGKDLLPVATKLLNIFKNEIIPVFKTGMTYVVDFFAAMTETSLERTIRELQELGAETLSLQVTLAKAEEITALSATTGLADKETLQNKLNDSINQELETLKKIGVEQANLLEMGKTEEDLRAQIRIEEAGAAAGIPMNDSLVIRNQKLLESLELLYKQKSEQEDQTAEYSEQLKSIQAAIIATEKRIELEKLASEQASEKPEGEGGEPEPPSNLNPEYIAGLASKAQSVLDAYELEKLETQEGNWAVELERLVSHEEDVVAALTASIKDQTELDQELTEAEQFFADKRVMIALAERNARLGIYADMLGGVSALFKQFAGGQKAAARLSQLAATVATYTAASQALQAPPVGYGPVLGPFAAIGIVAAGLANVMQISKAIGEMKTAQYGMDEIIRKPTLILTGEGNKAERVQVTPMQGQNLNGPKAIPTQTIINENHQHIKIGKVMTTEQFYRDEIRPIAEQIEAEGS